jgi:hypothetical protein
MQTAAAAPTAQITLPVSLGEALDKLTILDIKLQKIADERRADVQKEYDALHAVLKPYIDRFPYHYRILLDVNLTIWNTQDKFHGKDTTLEEGAILCNKILVDNDRRFRVKAKINALANSALREQKGYAKKKALVYTHLGLGDMFWMNGAVRYLATDFDEVVVVCKERNKTNVATMYYDDPSIKILVVNDDAELAPWPAKRAWFEEQGFKVFGCGFFAEKQPPRIHDLPNSFYDDLGLPREIRRTYFHVPIFPEAKQLAAEITAAGRPYIVVHQQSSVETLPIVESLRRKGETRLILDLNKNHYEPTQPEWAIAEKVVNRPVLEYGLLFEGADELHMIESSLYCFASHLDLSRVGRKVCYKPWGGNAERLGVFETGHLEPVAKSL